MKIENPAAEIVCPPYLKSGLPETIYAVPGIECSIYFENAVDTAVYRNYAYEVRCERGVQEEHRWCWTPEKDDAETFLNWNLRFLTITEKSFLPNAM